MTSYASFPTQGRIFETEVQPWHYRVEAENLRGEAILARRNGRHAYARHVLHQAQQFDAVADKHGWHPQALRSMSMRSELRDTDNTWRAKILRRGLW